MALRKTLRVRVLAHRFPVLICYSVHAFTDPIAHTIGHTAGSSFDKLTTLSRAEGQRAQRVVFFLLSVERPESRKILATGPIVISHLSILRSVC